MMTIKNKGLEFFGFLLVALGTFLLLNSFSGITGLAVVEEIGRTVSSVFGAILFIAGVGILMARAHHNLHYGFVAARVYESLGNRNSYGHKTEQISVVESRIAAHYNLDKRTVGNVIEEEIGSGRLVLDKSGRAVSISTRPEKLSEVVERFGSRIKDTVVERLNELKGRRLPAGVR